MFFLIILIFASICTGIYSAEVGKVDGNNTINLEFNDKDSNGIPIKKAYSLSGVLLFPKIKSAIGVRKIDQIDAVVLDIASEEFDTLFKFQEFIKNKTPDDIQNQVKEARRLISNNTPDTMVKLFEGAGYIIGDIANENTLSEPIIKLLIYIFVDLLKENNLPSNMNILPQALRRIIAGELLGSAIFDDAIDNNKLLSKEIKVGDKYIKQQKIGSYASDRYVVAYGARGSSYWLTLLDQNVTKAQNGTEIDLPFGGYSYDDQCFGVTPDNKYLYAMTKDKNGSAFVIYDIEQKKSQQKQLSNKIIAGLISSQIEPNELRSPQYRVAYNTQNGTFFVIFIITDKEARSNLFISSCKIDSEFMIQILNKDIFMKFLHEMDTRIPNKNNKPLWVRHEDFFLDLNWRYFDGYLIGISNFNKPGLICTISQENQQSQLHLIEYDDDKKRWTPVDQSVVNRDFISLAYPKNLTEDLAEDNANVTVSIVYANNFIPRYEQILNDILRVLRARVIRKIPAFKNKPLTFDAISLRYVIPQEFGDTMYIFDAIQPALRDVIQFINSNINAQTLVNAWYVYHANKNTTLYQNFNPNALPDEERKNISAFVTKTYRLFNPIKMISSGTSNPITIKVFKPINIRHLSLKQRTLILMQKALSSWQKKDIAPNMPTIAEKGVSKAATGTDSSKLVTPVDGNTGVNFMQKMFQKSKAFFNYLSNAFYSGT